LPADPIALKDARNAVAAGGDPLGECFCRAFSSKVRRPLGATYTPEAIVRKMVEAVLNRGPVDVVIDPGAGSARFLVAAGRAIPNARLIGIEIDPLAAILARGHLAAAGMQDRSEVILGDFREVRLNAHPGRKLFIGNPPYVRHHLIDPRWKQWLTTESAALGIKASQLAGLHAHFFLATAIHSADGDIGAYITSAEWLDVNYGNLVRELLVGPLGLGSVHLIEPDVLAFPGTATTAAITTFDVGGSRKTVGIHRVSDMSALDLTQSSNQVAVDRLKSASRWSPIIRAVREHREGFVELGELCRVHRGQVTGANKIWIEGPHSQGLPQSVLYRCVTKAKDLFSAGSSLLDETSLRRVIDLPIELDCLPSRDRKAVEAFLTLARSMGADNGYVARNRKAWWSVGLHNPAPVLATYMARRPPVFVRNVTEARHINVAHGLYPRVTLTERQLQNLAHHLSISVSVASGRTYAGGLTKFEPKEMERLLVPDPAALSQDHGAMQV
jgi:hypothetical protein